MGSLGAGDALSLIQPFGVLEPEYQRRYTIQTHECGPREMERCYQKGKCTPYGFFSFLHYVFFDFLSMGRLEVCLLIQDMLPKIARKHTLPTDAFELAVEMIVVNVWLHKC